MSRCSARTAAPRTPASSTRSAGNNITIVERRPPWSELVGPDWTSMKIAQLRYDDRARTWSLYAADRHERWSSTTTSRLRAMSVRSSPRSATIRPASSGLRSVLQRREILQRTRAVDPTSIRVSRFDRRPSQTDASLIERIRAICTAHRGSQPREPRTSDRLIQVYDVTLNTWRP